MKPIRILVVDDDSCVRAGLRSLLEDADGFEVAGETDAEDGALGLAAMCSPDLVVLDVDAASDGRGFTVLEAFAQSGFQGRVVVISLRDGPALRAKAEASGAGAFLDKGVAPDALLDVLRAIAAQTFSAEALDDPPLPERLKREAQPHQRNAA